MTDADLMQCVAGKSSAALRDALAALRAIRVGSPIVPLRLARTAERALADPEAVWTPDERAALVEAVARPASDRERDDPARARLSVLLTRSGLSAAEFARVVVGRDERTVRRWLSGEIAIPESAASWLARVVRVDATSGRVTVVLDR